MKSHIHLGFFVLSLILCLNANNLWGQDRLTYQLGLAYKMTGDPFLKEITPIFGVGYCIDEGNVVGLSLQSDCKLAQQDPSPNRIGGNALIGLYSYYLHDFQTQSSVNFYNEYKIGVADMVKPGLMIGLEPGLRLRISEMVSFRLGLCFQAACLSYKGDGGDSFSAVEYACGIGIKLDIE